MAKKVEVVFNEKDGKFVVHFSGVPIHDEEHKILDELIAQLKRQGFEAKVSHYHEKPKLPQFDDPQALQVPIKE